MLLRTPSLLCLLFFAFNSTGCKQRRPDSQALESPAAAIVDKPTCSQAAYQIALSNHDIIQALYAAEYAERTGTPAAKCSEWRRYGQSFEEIARTVNEKMRELRSTLSKEQAAAQESQLLECRVLTDVGRFAERELAKACSNFEKTACAANVAYLIQGDNESKLRQLLVRLRYIPEEYPSPRGGKILASDWKLRGLRIGQMCRQRYFAPDFNSGRDFYERLRSDNFVIDQQNK